MGSYSRSQFFSLSTFEVVFARGPLRGLFYARSAWTVRRIASSDRKRHRLAIPPQSHWQIAFFIMLKASLRLRFKRFAQVVVLFRQVSVLPM